MDPTVDPQWYRSVVGIIAATGLIVQILKRLVGNVPGLMKVPTWTYAAVVAVALTFASRYFGYLSDEGTLLDLLMLAGLSAASASGFWSWFSNGSAQIGDSATAVKARTGTGGNFGGGSLALLLAVSVGASACALKGDARKHVVVSMVGLHAALAALDDAERLLFDTKLVSADEHRQFSAKFVPVLETARQATVTVRQWPVGQPVPAEVRSLIEQVSALAADAVGVFKDGEPKSKILAKILFVQNAAIAILSVVPLPTNGRLETLQESVTAEARLVDRLEDRRQVAALAVAFAE